MTTEDSKLTLDTEPADESEGDYDYWSDAHYSKGPIRGRDGSQELVDISPNELIDNVPTKIMQLLLDGYQDYENWDLDGEKLEQWDTMMGVVMGNLRPGVYCHTARTVGEFIYPSLRKIAEFMKRHALYKDCKDLPRLYRKIAETDVFPDVWIREPPKKEKKKTSEQSITSRMPKLADKPKPKTVAMEETKTE